MGDTRADTDELPHLIKLLDDDSETVRAAVGSRLFAMRGDLDEELRRRKLTLRDDQRTVLDELCRVQSRKKVIDEWEARRLRPGDTERLETGLAQIADFLRGYRQETGCLTVMLDQLAEKARFKGVDSEIDDLNDFLFCSGRFLGNRSDYYGPQNGDMTWVLDSGRGNPISLACVFILVGRRCGLQVDGCNYPGHFLARYEWQEEVHLIDCFNRGKVIPGSDLIEHQPFSSHEVSEAIHYPAAADTIIARVLRNLETAFSRLGNREDQKVVQRLLQMTLS